MALRKPQEDSLAKVHELVVSFRKDLDALTQPEFEARLKDLRPTWDVSGGVPYLTFALATGVGKTRLMAALIAYLFLGGQSKCFVLLAPRRAILRKVIAQVERADAQYLFADPALLPEVRLWHAGNATGFVPPDPATDRGLNLFVFSPQSFVGGDRIVARTPEFGGVSILDYLRSRDDLVALLDESHHLGRLVDKDTQAWTQAVRDMAPRLAFAMTATPRAERGANIVHTYSLREALRDKLYTKDVRLIVRERTDADRMSDDDWDHLVLDFALDRLAKKEDAIRRYTGPEPFPKVTPVVLVAAENTTHADQIAGWLKQQRGLDDSEVLTTHSRKTKTEDELDRLVGIERPDSRVRVVVNVFELTEGWDVTNVYAIAPLRAMGTYQGAIQTMGRGLRLPAGHRLDDRELDSLDVLCFGRQSLEDVLSRALEDYGSEEQESTVDVMDQADDSLHEPPAAKSYEVVARLEIELQVPRIRRVAIEPDLNFDIRTVRSLARASAAELELSTLSIAGSAEGLKYEFEVVVRLASARVVSGLRYLSDPLHGEQVEKLVAKFLEALKFERGKPAEVDWMFVAAIVADEIDKRYRRLPVSFEAMESSQTFSFGGYEWMVPETFHSEVQLGAGTAWQPSLHRRIPIGGWKRSTGQAAAFDTSQEFLAARVIDRASAASWWARNDPPRLVISTPIGQYAPDFVVGVKDTGQLIIEIKQSAMWEAPESDARVKARAALAWCAALTAAEPGDPWSYWVILDEDVERAKTLEDLGMLNIADAGSP
jgi:superfamily II DNA or RNA helicase